MSFQTIYLCLFIILSNALTPYDRIEEKKQRCLRKQLQVYYDLVWHVICTVTCDTLVIQNETR